MSSTVGSPTSLSRFAPSGAPILDRIVAPSSRGSGVRASRFVATPEGRPIPAKAVSAIPRKIAIELRYLQRIAYTDWIAARILRNLGFFYQPMWLLGQSIEKYVYILWIESHARLPQGRLRRKLKEFSARGVGMRGLAPLFNALPKATKTLLHESWQSWVKYESAYRGKIPFAGYSDTAFRVSERFVRDIRVVLGETPKKSFLEEWVGIAAQHSPLKRERMVQVMKGILALKNPTLTKRLRRTYARKIRQIAELFQRA